MFKFKNAQYLTSAVNKAGWINDDLMEICVLGRSNVGKSSFLNMLTNNKQLAKVSQQPGKTKMLNFFSINNNTFRLVDAPGYGFARVSNDQKDAFGELMERYLTERNNLKFVCLLIDLRHLPTGDDLAMYEFLKYHHIKTVIIGTKLDKLKRNDINKNEKLIKETLGFNPTDDFIKTSSKDKIGREECWKIFANLLGLE
ncbi:ribosome biogenesis GTP-binding protein YihA/YsxC [Spiroplasma chrysopicola]|uniref:Probable GTP-binding protein EngB n=1 Tax=Spiroplasma chrysopicola DF-1 TaxID=1276227 RepID=R4U331_9MOLU|nr:ribosome biogenesis GTP-binding protein YihA/YsxC [Spiroplasma chrysopicola]AGM24898.1 GTP-binding protein YsxC [Spiroplasma chrysopicola DF-1]